VKYVRTALANVAEKTKSMPDSYINEAGKRRDAGVY
jgi:hypothetical protein